MKNIFKAVTAIFLIALSALSLSASSRVGVGGTFLSVNSNGMLEGTDWGVRRVKSLAPGIAIEGEIVPVEQLSIILKASAAPFKPAITTKGEVLPSTQNTVDSSTLTASAAVGLGWQIPLSYLTRYDCPFEITIGGVFDVGFFNLNYDTPKSYFSGKEISLGAGTYENVSFYLGTVGFSLSSSQTFSFGDFSWWTMKKTGAEETSESQYVNTPIIFSWDVSLALSFRFGY